MPEEGAIMGEEPDGLSMDSKLQYPKVPLEDYVPRICLPRVYEECHNYIGDCNLGSLDNDMRKTVERTLKTDNKSALTQLNSDGENVLDNGKQNCSKNFYYDTQLSEETGSWNMGLYTNGDYMPDADLGWNECIEGEDKEMTLWDVVLDMLLAARGKFTAVTSGDIIYRYGISWMPSHLLEQAWNEMAQTITDANFGKMKEILEAAPPKWLPDSAAAACMLCNVRFHPIMCSRHHCRFCGGIFCNSCSKGRSLMPSKFRTGDPQRVCDVCCVRLECVQTCLRSQVSRAAQAPTHDLTDLSTLRSWLNFPWGQSMEHEIYKAANTIQGYTKVGSLTPENSIPGAILKQAKGLAILTVAKVGLMVTYNIGTGLVVARREDGSWSPPSAIASFGMGWGAQVGGEVTDFIIVLGTNSAIKTFSGNAHLSVGAGLSAALGIVGRSAEADIRAGDGGCAACYTYSCSKGAFVGCSLEGNIVKTRSEVNSRFYGNPSISASQILLGSMPQPPAASALYQALSELYQRH